uniref:Uncharacterized protein n=1 Tax=Cacopsylla melanoneura TaxID=428564 RepID=A0A8D9APK7_9HEMI
MYIFINFKMGSVSRVGEQNGCLALLSNGILKRHSFKIPFENFKIHSQNELYESVDTSLVKIHQSIKYRLKNLKYTPQNQLYKSVDTPLVKIHLSIRAVHGGITCVHDRVSHSVIECQTPFMECH